RDISFHIPEGSFQFITGASGTGKTSLMRLMFLAIKQTRGHIDLFGNDTALLKRRELPALRQRIGVVFQDFRLLDHMTTYENVALPLRIKGQEEATYRSEVEDLLRWVGLGNYIHVLPP
ncbi:MAG: ATP-binding cassette domain-containing protein, partial [Bartonella sp.]|nr:ATP-binding cassette domain-containing protein [Bartonella sp.]